MTLNKDDITPLFQQLEDLIRNKITSGELAPGDRIPSEAELCETYNISRMTVRRALDRLVLEGLLVRRQGKGAFVAQGKVSYTPATIFSFSTAMRQLGYTVQTQVIDLKTVPLPAEAAAELRLPAGSPGIFLQRLRFLDNQPATLHVSYMPAEYYSGLLSEDLTSQPLTRVMEKVSGLRIINTEDTFEATLARAYEASLLGISQSAPVLLVRGVAMADAGFPVRFTKAVFRGDLFRFSFSPNGSPVLQVRMQEKKSEQA